MSKGPTRGSWKENQTRADLASLLFSALTGRDRPADKNDLRGMLISAFGTGPRGGPDTRTAAKELGVSQRTVERWITTAGEKSKPKPKNLKTLRSKVRSARSSKAGRRRALGGKDKKDKYGGKIHARALQGPVSRDYWRYRDVTLDLDPDEIEAMRNAYIDGGEDEYMNWLEDKFSTYVPDWQFGDLEALDFYDP